MKSLTLLLAFFVSMPAIAKPAMKFTCKGFEQYYQTPIEFNIVYADWSLEGGYDYQAVEITSEDGKPVDKVVDLKEKVLPDCTPEQSSNDLTLIQDGKRWKATYLRACDAEVHYQIEATCEKTY